MRFHRTYALAALAVLLLEIGIAAFVHDDFVRPHLGDSLAVVLVYFGLRAISRIRAGTAMAAAFAIACGIEVGQWFGLVGRLGLGGSPLARIVLGTGFDPIDVLAYAGGVIAILIGRGVCGIVARSSQG